MLFACCRANHVDPAQSRRALCTCDCHKPKPKPKPVYTATFVEFGAYGCMIDAWFIKKGGLIVAIVDQSYYLQKNFEAETMARRIAQLLNDSE